jgi:versiconal hemiacetal acetate reductase
VLSRPWGNRETHREKTDEVDEEIVGRVEEVPKRLGKSMAQVAMAWYLAKDVMPIVGLGSKARIDEAVEAVKIRLSEEDVRYLEELYQPKVRTGYCRRLAEVEPRSFTPFMYV